MLSAAPYGLSEGERRCNGGLTAGLWQPQPVPSLRETKREKKGAGRKKKERSYHNMLLNVIVVARLQITSSECHERCCVHTAATPALLNEKRAVSKHMEGCDTS